MMSSQKRFSSAKIVIFGNSGVGKTAFAVRYITKRFIGDYDKDRGPRPLVGIKKRLKLRPVVVESLQEERRVGIWVSLGFNVSSGCRSRTRLLILEDGDSTSCADGVLIFIHPSGQLVRYEMVYTYKLPTAREISLEILDTASQYSEETLERHMKWGDGFILMYSVTDKESLVYLQKIKDQLAKTKPQEDFPIVLVGNKCDLVLAREIDDDDVHAALGGFNCPKFEISVADECQSVNEVMDELLCLLKQEFVKNLNAANAASPVDKTKSKLYSMKKAFKKRINKSHSDTF